jgi:hypothetical protein
MGKQAVTRIPSKVHARYGNDRDPLIRVPFGLGQDPGTPGAAERCLKCSFGNVPVTEEVVWTILMPMSHAATQQTFGDIINLFGGNSTPAGVCSVDSTFLINGILQTDLYCTGIGIHVFVEPLVFTAIGNGWVSPETPGQPAPSPDVWTLNDLNNGALGSVAQVGTSANPLITPADLDWGGCGWDAGWNFINAYQLQFRTNQRELMLNEMLADVAYFASFGDAIAAGTSEVAVIEYAALANAQYRALGSPSIFLPANFRRYGSVGSSPGGNIGLFHATRDFDFAPATRGGIKFQGTNCCGQMYRKVEKPCFFERGIPIGPQFIVVDPCHQARFQAAISIDSFTGSQNLQPDVNVSGFTLTGTNVMLEQTLDLTTPANIPEQVTVERQSFKGGIFKMGVKLKGWEMPGKWKTWCQQNLPQMNMGGQGGTSTGMTAT